jgi:hypothetical protein
MSRKTSSSEPASPPAVSDELAANPRGRRQTLCWPVSGLERNQPASPSQAHKQAQWCRHKRVSSHMQSTAKHTVCSTVAGAAWMAFTVLNSFSFHFPLNCATEKQREHQRYEFYAQLLANDLWRLGAAAARECAALFASAHDAYHAIPRLVFVHMAWVFARGSTHRCDVAAGRAICLRDRLTRQFCLRNGLLSNLNGLACRCGRQVECVWASLGVHERDTKHQRQSKSFWESHSLGNDWAKRPY